MESPKADDERRHELLHDMSRRIVTTREITPRNPRWQRMWKKTLLRYIETLQDMAQQEQKPPG
jgi:hypothetical protein